MGVRRVLPLPLDLLLDLPLPLDAVGGDDSFSFSLVSLLPPLTARLVLGRGNRLKATSG